MRVSSDGEEREQHTEDDPNVNAHHSNPRRRVAREELGGRQYTPTFANGSLMLHSKWLGSRIQFDASFLRQAEAQRVSSLPGAVGCTDWSMLDTYGDDRAN